MQKNIRIDSWIYILKRVYFGFNCDFYVYEVWSTAFQINLRTSSASQYFLFKFWQMTLLDSSKLTWNFIQICSKIKEVPKIYNRKFLKFHSQFQFPKEKNTSACKISFIHCYTSWLLHLKYFNRIFSSPIFLFSTIKFSILEIISTQKCSFYVFVWCKARSSLLKLEGIIRTLQCGLLIESN